MLVNGKVPGLENRKREMQVTAALEGLKKLFYLSLDLCSLFVNGDCTGTLLI